MKGAKFLPSLPSPGPSLRTVLRNRIPSETEPQSMEEEGSCLLVLPVASYVINGLRKRRGEGVKFFPPVEES